MALNRVIKLLGEPIQNEDNVAAAAITPGMLVDFDAGGNLVPHATAADTEVVAVFAMHREEAGKTIDDAYAIGDVVKVGHFGPGTRVHAFLAAGENVAKGALLESAGDGSLQAATVGKAIFRAYEAVNNGAGVDMVRIIVEVIG
jgi:hypothetical protein